MNNQNTELTGANQKSREVSGQHPVRRHGLPLTAIVCLFLSTGLWAGEPGEPSETTTEKASQSVVAKADIPTGWKPPEMPKPEPFSTQKIDPEVARDLKENWGVELLGMRLATAGYMLDFRFRVLDADKALPLFDHRIKPHIVAERSNIKLPVPMATKVGAFRPTNRGKNIKADKTYYMMFGNPDRHVKVGEKVTVVIGDFKVEHLVVN